MERERRRKMLDRMLKKCPDRLKTTEVPQWFPIGKNTVYQLIADGKLRSHRMTYGYVILKEDFIEYLLDSCDESHRNFGVRQKREDVI